MSRRADGHCHQRSAAGARLVSGRMDVEVNLEQGIRPATDGQRILLPAPRPGGLEALEDHRAGLAHEAGHVRYTDTELARQLSPHTRYVFNVLEDTRIDELVERSYLGYGKDLQRSAFRAAALLRRRMRVGALDPVNEVLSGILVEHALGRPPQLSPEAAGLRESVAPELARLAGLRHDPTLGASREIAGLAQRIVERWGDERVQQSVAHQAVDWHETPCANAHPGEADAVAAADVSGGPEASALPPDEPSEVPYTACTDTDRVGRCTEVDDATYRSDLEAVARNLPAVRQALRRSLRHHPRPRTLGEQRSGPQLDPQALWRLPALGETRIFESTLPGSQPDACFALLVDESGSMRGPAIATARQAALLLATTLGELGVPVLVAGHSTVEPLPLSGADLQRVQERQRAGFVRCDSLWLQVYKGFDEPARVAGRRIATMQARSHNIDGEALLQVALLAARRPEAHRHLLTLSDGHPEGSCHEQLLATHLRDVAAMAAAAGVDVTAVGIRTEAVKLYHPRWLVIHKLEDLAPALVGLATRALRAAPGRRRR